MDAAGFTNIQNKHYKTHVGGWSTDPHERQTGLSAQLALSADLEGFLLYTLSEAGWRKEEITVYAAQLRRELKSPNIRSYFKQKVVWGQKPLDAA